MTIARVSGQTDQFAFTTSGTSIGMTFPQNVVASNAIMVAACSHNVGAGTLTDNAAVTDNLGNTYTKDRTHQFVDEHRGYIFSCKNIDLSGACTATYSHAGDGANRRIIGGMEYTFFGGAVLDQVNSGTGTSTAASSGNAVTTIADELLFGGLNTGGATVTWTAGTGWTIRGQDTGARAAFEDRIVSASGTYVADATLSVSELWSALIATYAEGPPPKMALVGHGTDETNHFTPVSNINTPAYTPSADKLLIVKITTGSGAGGTANPPPNHVLSTPWGVSSWTLLQDQIDGGSGDQSRTSIFVGVSGSSPTSTALNIACDAGTAGDYYWSIEEWTGIDKASPKVQSVGTRNFTTALTATFGATVTAGNPVTMSHTNNAADGLPSSVVPTYTFQNDHGAALEATNWYRSNAGGDTNVTVNYASSRDYGIAAVELRAESPPSIRPLRVTQSGLRW